MAKMANPWTVSSAIISGAQDAIIGWRLDGSIASWNDGAERLFGYTVDEVLGRSSAFLAVRSSSPNLLVKIHQIQQGEQPPPYEDAFRRKDGRVVPVSVAVSPVRDGSEQLCGVSQIVRPLPAGPTGAGSRATEIENEALRRKLLRLSRWSAAGHVAATLADELTQPLTATVAYLTAGQRVLHRNRMQDVPDLVEAIDRAYEQAGRTARIIQDLRAFLSYGDSEPQDVPLRSVLLEAAERARTDASQTSIAIAFDVDADAVVLADRAQLQDVALTLMRNAVAAASAMPSGQLHVSTARSARDVVVSIAHTGFGVSPEVAAGLSDLSGASEPHDMGLGLEICRTIIAAHGGELWVDSEPPHGAIYRFKLPLRTIDDATPGIDDTEGDDSPAADGAAG